MSKSKKLPVVLLTTIGALLLLVAVIFIIFALWLNRQSSHDRVRIDGAVRQLNLSSLGEITYNKQFGGHPVIGGAASASETVVTAKQAPETLQSSVLALVQSQGYRRVNAINGLCSAQSPCEFQNGPVTLSLILYSPGETIMVSGQEAYQEIGSVVQGEAAALIDASL